MRTSSALPAEKLPFVLTLFLTASLSGEFWNSDPNQFRGLVEVFVLGSDILFVRPPPPSGCAPRRWHGIPLVADCLVADRQDLNRYTGRCTDPATVAGRQRRT